jgi:hypothetical protein
MNMPNYVRLDRWFFAMLLLCFYLALPSHAWAQG